MDKNWLSVLLTLIVIFVVVFSFLTREKPTDESLAEDVQVTKKENILEEEVELEIGDGNNLSNLSDDGNPPAPNGSGETKEVMTMEKPKMMIDKTKTYQAILSTTEGEIVVDLNAAETPITVNNFVYLARAGFYDNTIFHRVIANFMIQGGDPEGTGRGGPGYRFDDESFSGSYTRGTVAMANAGPDTNGSQFFIMHKDYNLPSNYVIFGKVSEGMEVVDKIATANVTMSSSGELSKPVNPVTVKSVEIVEE